MSSAGLDREDCAYCGGSGQVTQMVAGRSGYVPCDHCDNVPKFAVPSDPPRDPHARLEELDDRLEALRAQTEAASEVAELLGEASDALSACADKDVLDECDQAVIAHLSNEVNRVHGRLQPQMQAQQAIRSVKEQRRKLQRFIDHLEDNEQQD